jgi:hypothetical protein
VADERLLDAFIFVERFSNEVVLFSFVAVFVFAFGSYILGSKSPQLLFGIEHQSSGWMAVFSVLYPSFLLVAAFICVNMPFLSGIMMGSGHARSEEFLQVGNEYVITGIMYGGILDGDIEVVLLNVTVHERQIWSFQNLPPRCFVVRARYIYEAKPQCQKNTLPGNTDKKPNLRVEGSRSVSHENNTLFEAIV